MVNVLTDYSKPKLITAIHRSWNNCIHKLLSDYQRAEYLVTPQYTLIKSGLKVAMFNRVMKSNLAPEETDKKIQEVKQYFDSKSLPFIWQVDPEDKPRDLAERLEKAGFQRREGRGMAVKIAELVEPRNPEGFRYEKVRSREKLEVYARLLPKAYGMPEFAWDWGFGCFKHLGLVDDFQHYIGYLDDIPVATSSILYGDGLAGLYNVATLPEFRGKGIGSMMSYVPFIDTMERGYKIGILQTIILRFYERLGFEEIYKRVSYRWTPSQ